MFKSIVILSVCLFLAATALAATTTIGGAHREMDFTCVDCHGTDHPQAAPRIAQCLTCHGSYEELAELTAPATEATGDPEEAANPHDSHMGPIECADCHKTHSKSVLVCEECHFFDMVPK